MRRIVLGVLAAVALVLFAPHPAAAATTITLDADGSSYPLAAVASDWSKNTGVSVVTGDCTGANCVHYKDVSPNVPCSWSSFIAGCAYRLSDGSCQVELMGDFLRGHDNLTLLVTKHETGHCVFSYGGVAVSYHLPDSPHALMSAVQPGAPKKPDTMLTNTDRSFTRSLY